MSTSPASALVLASASPRRAELLRLAGLEFTVHPVDCDERWYEGEAPVAYAQRIARAKAELAARELGHLPNALVLTADTTVWLRADAPVLGKPADRAEARAMLRALTLGEPHRVTTACAFARAGVGVIAELEATTAVFMRRFDDAEFERFIGAYLDAGDWTDKAGGYAIQGRAAALVERIEGSYSAVVGLPLAQVVARVEALLDRSGGDA